ncbi:MAG TPA: DNA polymerase III subunit gamma/tau C-terminal domain-containing protein, partial [Steroidobacteraceae bacterium]|nr:DNA polymerase III subunit gamma/tau C-terminal domain-containing protein [Steroidobacteraceae bacterium]
VTDQATAFALTLLRMLLFRPDGGAAAPGVGAGNTAVRGTAPRAVPAAVAREAAPAAGTGLPLAPDNWAAIVRQLGLTALAGQLAANCALLGRQGAQVRLLLDPRGVSMRNRGTEEKLAAALSHYLGEPVKLSFELAAPDAAAVTPARDRDREAGERRAQAQALLESDPTIQALRNEMGATIFPESIRATIDEEG